AGGIDTVHGGGGNDTIFGGDGFQPSDLIDGGDGNDTLRIDDDYSGGVLLASDTIVSIENFEFAVGHSYSLTFSDGNVAAGQTLTLDTTELGSANAAILNGTAETDGKFHLVGGDGADIFAGGARADDVDGGAGNDNLSCFDGDDIVNG